MPITRDRERDNSTERERENQRVMGSEAEPDEQSTTTVPRLPLFPSVSPTMQSPEPSGRLTPPLHSSTVPRLPLFSSVSPTMQSPEPSGMLTPPLHSSSASVPFRWEQVPGKPKPCTSLVTFSNTKCLELPPRLLLSKIPTPTMLLEASPQMGSNRFRSPSFRMSKDCYGSFGAERGQLGAMILSKGRVGFREKSGWFGSWRKKSFKVKREVSAGSSHVFPSSADRETDLGGVIGGSHKRVKMTKVKRPGSFSNLTHTKSGVWTTIREGLKHMVPWKSKKLKKDGYGLKV